ncbi:MAG: hypothetical protein ACREF9_11210 [Opitutaceae bacterium]
MSGLAAPAFASAEVAGQECITPEIPRGDDRDVTDTLNSALARSSEVWLPSGIYRVDGTVVVPKHTQLTMAHGAILQRFAKHTDNRGAVVALLGNRAYCSGGRIITQNDHPQGIVTLGHADASLEIRYNATNWYFANCAIEGRQSPGNIGLWVPSSQVAHRSTDFANYFGYVQNVSIQGADIGVLLDEVANAHRFFGILFSRLISTAWELRGAYGNQVFGGFLHKSRDGVVGIRLRNASNDQYHDSIYNSFLGFGIEPGGKKSTAYRIDSRCRMNTLILQSNVATKGIDENGNNFISRHGGSWPRGA